VVIVHPQVTALPPDLTDTEDEASWLRPPRTYKGSPLQRYHQAERDAREAREAQEREDRERMAPILAKQRIERRASLIRHHSAKRRAAKLRSTPAWANLQAIATIYAEADRLTRETGIVHHVDHDIPLQHPLVCGLHVESNLRVLTASDNIRKSNKFEP